MTRPVIGLTAYPRDVGGPDHGRIEGIDDRYIRVVVAAGGVPVVLPTLDPPDAGLVLDRVDALVLTGGGDVEPHHYGQGVVTDLVDIDPRRDDFELALAKEAAARRLPTLGICRGMQCLNVAFGGTLHQSLEDLYPASDHRRSIEEIVHEVDVIADTRLSGLVGAGPLKVNSRHHQSIDLCAPGFAVTARSADGVIEAFERTDQQWWVLGVQWHPEGIGGSMSTEALLRALVLEASRSADEGRDEQRFHVGGLA